LTLPISAMAQGKSPEPVAGSTPGRPVANQGQGTLPPVGPSPGALGMLLDVHATGTKPESRPISSTASVISLEPGGCAFVFTQWLCQTAAHSRVFEPGRGAGGAGTAAPGQATAGLPARRLCRGQGRAGQPAHLPVHAPVRRGQAGRGGWRAGADAGWPVTEL
jgi:hypothetical protein